MHGKNLLQMALAPPPSNLDAVADPLRDASVPEPTLDVHGYIPAFQATAIGLIRDAEP